MTAKEARALTAKHYERKSPREFKTVLNKVHEAASAGRDNVEVPHILYTTRKRLEGLGYVIYASSQGWIIQW